MFPHEMVPGQDRIVLGRVVWALAGRDALHEPVVVDVVEVGETLTTGVSTAFEDICAGVRDPVQGAGPLVVGPHRHEVSDVDHEVLRVGLDIVPFLGLRPHLESTAVILEEDREAPIVCRQVSPPPKREREREVNMGDLNQNINKDIAAVERGSRMDGGVSHSEINSGQAQMKPRELNESGFGKYRRFLRHKGMGVPVCWPARI